MRNTNIARLYGLGLIALACGLAWPVSATAEPELSPTIIAADTSCTQNTTNAINAALLESRWVVLSGCHLIDQAIVIPSETTLGGLGEKATLRIDPNSEAFRVTDIEAFHYPTQNASVIWAHTAQNVTVEHLSIQSDRTSPYILHAVIFTNIQNATVRNMTINGFSNAKGIVRLDTTFNSRIEGNVIGGGTTRGNQQLTGIAIDEMAVRNARDEKVWSNGVTVRNNYIQDLLPDAEMKARRQAETDGINVGGIGTTNVVIEGNTIRDVGEGIDTFGSSGRITNNVIHNSFLAGIKLIHGAADNQVSNNLIDSAGMFGIVLGESHEVETDASGNRVIGNTIIGRRTEWMRHVDGHYTQAAFATLSRSDATSRVTNTVFSGNIIVDRGGWDIMTLCESAPLAAFEENTIRTGSDLGCDPQARP